MNRFNSMSYVPILRWKRAEQSALAKLYERDRICVTPLVELVPENFEQKDAEGNINRLTVSEVVNKVGRQIFQYWGERQFFVDLWLLSPDHIDQGPSDFLTQLSRYASTLSLSLIPVTGIARDGAYQSAVRAAVKMHNQGACLRLTRDDIERASLAQDINNLLSDLKISMESVDLVIDFQIIDRSVPEYKTLCKLLPSIDKWRNFIVASGAFPQDLMKWKKNDIYRDCLRNDWISWRDQAISRRSVVRFPIYSDYTIQYPQYRGRIEQSNYSASIRYTADEYWVIMRGEGVLNDGGPGASQWPANALLLCEQPEYKCCGDIFSYGDKYIKEKSGKYDKPGSARTWLQAGINHHMTFVVRQIATLLDSSTVALP